MSSGRREGGVALILVLFIISIASIITVTLSYNVMLESRVNQMVERSLQAEYYMKSALEFSRMLVAFDSNTRADGKDDFWWAYSNGGELPLELMGLSPPLNLKVYVEVAPINRRMPINIGKSPEWRNILLRLFESLGFDQDGETNHIKNIGISEDEVFTPAEMVANLSDYLDDDDESFSDPNFPGTGIEASLPKGYFPESTQVDRTRIDDLRELQRIPGFTPARVRLLSNYVHTAPIQSVNLNVASTMVIKSLTNLMTDDMAQQIFDYVRSEDGPFEQQTAWRSNQLVPLTSSQIDQELGSRVTTRSSDYEVVCKVDYGESRYYMRAWISSTPSTNRQGELPRVNSVEFFF